MFKIHSGKIYSVGELISCGAVVRRHLLTPADSTYFKILCIIILYSEVCEIFSKLRENVRKHMFLNLRVITIIFFHIKIKVKHSLQFTSNKHVITPAQYITLISTQSCDHRLKQRFWNVSTLKKAILWVPLRTTIVTPTTATIITTSIFLTLNHRQEFIWAQKLNVHNIIYILYIILSSLFKRTLPTYCKRKHYITLQLSWRFPPTDYHLRFLLTSMIIK